MIFYRIFIKIYTAIEQFYNKSVLEVCKQKGLIIGKNVRFEGRIYFGSEPFLIEIGDNTGLADGVRFINHGGTTTYLRRLKGYEDARIFGRIKVGKNCLLGLNSVITENVEIGDNCILGSNSVLTQSMPSNTVFAGNPAQYICTIEEYGDIILNKNTIYPRELEANKQKLDAYLKENIPHKYKKAKKK